MLLCIVLFVSVLTVSAFAATIEHYAGERGVTTAGTNASWINYNNQLSTHYFPENSSFNLIADLYNTDTYANVSIFDPIDHYRIEDTSVRKSILSFT